MGALFPTSFDDSKASKEQEKRCFIKEHHDRMELVMGIKRSIERPNKNKVIGKLLRSATPLQKTRIRARLESEITKWSCKGAPIEAGIAKRALRAFDAGKYNNGHIARYLSEKVIEKIFS